MPGFSPSSVLRAASHSKSDVLDTIRTLALTKTNWADTLALPRSQFPARPTPEQLETYRQRVPTTYTNGRGNINEIEKMEEKTSYCTMGRHMPTARFMLDMR
jgi:hypothetical protein